MLLSRNRITIQIAIQFHYLQKKKREKKAKRKMRKESKEKLERSIDDK
jgi:hypothetical protein